MRRLWIGTVIAASTIGGLAFSANAAGTNQQPAQKVSALPAIVVTPSRAPTALTSVPATTYRIDATDAVQSKGVRTTPDALQGVPSVMVQKTSYGQGSPFLRGFTGFRTLCLVDGVRLNNSVFRDGPNQYWNTVDPLSVRDYELVMGPGSVLYGSDAIGGVLNALTVAPAAWDGEPDLQGRLLYRGATADESSSGRIEVGGNLNEHLAGLFGLSAKTFGDLHGGDEIGKQEETGYDEFDVDGKLLYRFNKDSVLTLAHQTVDQNDAWRTHRTIYGIDWEGLALGDDKIHTYDQHRDLTYLRYQADDRAGFIQAMEVTVSRQLQSEDLYRVKKDDKSDKQGFDVETLGVAAQFATDSKIGKWVYGAEFYRDDVNSYLRKYRADGSLEKTEVQGPVADDATYDSLGVYLQNTFSLFGEHLDVTPGIRYNNAQADAEKVKDPITGSTVSLDDEWNAVVASLRLLCPLSEDRSHVVFASAAQGFRAPNLSDLTRLDTARSGELETPSTDLDPEEFVAYEVGIRSVTRKLVSQLSYYYTTIDRMILRTPTGRVIDDSLEVTKRNSGDGYIQGLELSGRLLFTEQWSAWAALTWMEGKVDSYPTSTTEAEEDYVSRIMPLTAQAGVRWQSEQEKLWTEFVADLADKADKLSADDERDTQRIPPGGTPGYAVFALRAGSHITRDLDLSLSLENILDRDYRIHGSGVNEPGRNLVFTASYAF